MIDARPRTRPNVRALANPADDLTAVALRLAASAVTLAVAVILTLTT